MVRQLFISSAAAFVTEFHVDGFRVDQTTSIHAYAKLHADGRPADRAKEAGIAFLRQWTQTMRLIKPGVFLTAEDHSGWAEVTRPYEQGGLGFDATWYSDFYHHLVDFGQGGSQWAKLLRNAGYGDGRPLAMSYFAGALASSGTGKVVYNDSHDEAGNSEGSARTIRLAVNNAPLVGETRFWAEARIRVAAALTLLSAGTPMFFMGEEVGAAEPYRYDDFLVHREDFRALRAGSGAALFRCYRDLITLGRESAAIRSRNIDILYTHDQNRILAFRRWQGNEDILVVASLNEGAFGNGYRIRHPALAGKGWREVFNSDAALYGGGDVGNGGRMLEPAGDELNPVIPASGVLVFRAA
jgi:1,4-alpha-glucan branching enzyme